MDKYQAIQSFWSGFGWDAFNEHTVPDNAFNTRDGYITYAVTEAEFGYPVQTNASIWQRSAGWTGVLTKAKQIERELSNGGKLIPCDEGVIWIKMGAPFAQTLMDVDDSVRRVYLTLEVEFLTTV